MSRHVADSGRTRSIIAVAGSFVLVLALGTVGWLLVRPSSSKGDRSAAGSTSTDDPTLPVTTSTTPTVAPTTAKPTPKKTTAKPKPRATPTKKPSPAQLPPAPKPKPDDPSCETHLPGTDASKSQVKAALLAAAGHSYWNGVQPPADLVGTLPTITVPPTLIKAIAWTESSWRSTVIACDLGVGTMQVMRDTGTWMNDRFDTNYDIETLSGNTSLGAEYFEWLVVYFGLYYFGAFGPDAPPFNLDMTADVGTGGTTIKLRDAAIAAYNVGFAEVEDVHGTKDPSDDTLSIPNQWYVDRVVANMASSCPCQTY